MADCVTKQERRPPAVTVTCCCGELNVTFGVGGAKPGGGTFKSMREVEAAADLVAWLHRTRRA